MRKLLVIGVLFAGLMAINSCGGHPFACFTTSIDQDSIHVNQPVTFAANCSSSANDYRWEFYNNPDSTSFDYSVTRTFYTPGDVQVFLLVIGNGKEASTTQIIHVLP